MLFGGEEEGGLGGEAVDDVLLLGFRQYLVWVVGVSMPQRTFSVAMGWPDEVPVFSAILAVEVDKLLVCCVK